MKTSLLSESARRTIELQQPYCFRSQLRAGSWIRQGGFLLAFAGGFWASTPQAQAQFPGQVPPGRPYIQGPPLIATAPVRPAAPKVSTHQRLVNLASGHSVCLVVGEGLASSFVGTDTTDEGPFQDFVMGAQVNGTQKTKAHTTLDFTPDPNTARMLYVLKGVTANETVALVQRAAIRSAGTFEFEMTKQIEFNGQAIRTWSPSAFMKIRQEHLGAETAVSNVPLLGPLANNIVLNVAEQRKPMSENIAAHRVTQQVAPQFNSRLDQELAKLNQQLHGPLKNQMAAKGMLPSRISTMTTDDALLCGFEFQPPLAEAADSSGAQILAVTQRAPTKLITRRLVPTLESQSGFESLLEAPTPYSLDAKTLRDRACLLIHASLIENLADRFRVAGREIPDTQVQRLFGDAPASGENAKPQLYTLLIAKEQPVTAEIDGGEFVVSIRLGIRPVVGPEIPTQVVKVVLQPTLTDDQLTLKPTLRSIEPLVPGKEGQLGIAASMMIRQGIEQRLKESTFARNFEVPRQDDRPAFKMRVQNVTLVDGWMTVTLEQPGVPKSAEVDSGDEAGEVLR
ncbi:hypothetical protein SH661x_003918 [Planctomicrobium sp. SH661]|uniref:hypothetical protein n=1 Tax=Planctomicrobium sp. SH661 TaxID=3448124 RepID=UPI003F5B0DF0